MDNFTLLIFLHFMQNVAKLIPSIFMVTRVLYGSFIYVVTIVLCMQYCTFLSVTSSQHSELVTNTHLNSVYVGRT
jgi:hypothetical protein